MFLLPAKRLASAAGLALLATTTLAGCGNDRPSVDEVSAALQKGDNAVTEEKVADCMAKVFVDSDLSDETLRKAVEDDELDEKDIPEADKKVVEDEAFLTDLMDCAKESQEYKDMEQQMDEFESEMPELEIPEGEMPEMETPSN